MGIKWGGSPYKFGQKVKVRLYVGLDGKEVWESGDIISGMYDNSTDQWTFNVVLTDGRIVRDVGTEDLRKG